MRKISKAEMAEYIEQGLITPDKIINLSNWIIAWIHEGEPTSEVVYVEI